MLAYFCALFAVVVQAKYPPPKIQKCTEYFGSDTTDQNKLITVIDADVPSLFCGLAKLKAPCTFVHRSGPGAKCAPPTPPDKCHRYRKITYKKGTCAKLTDAKVQKLAGTLDVKGEFDASTGIIKGCENDVEETKMMCYAPKKAISQKPPPNFPDSYDVETCDCSSVKLFEENLGLALGSPHDASMPVNSMAFVLLVSLFGAIVAVRMWRNHGVPRHAPESDGLEMAGAVE